MEKKIIIIIVVAAVIGSVVGLIVTDYVYNSLHADQVDVEYDYETGYYGTSYVDGNGIRHYASSGNVYIIAEINEKNVSDRDVLGLPNCYSAVTSTTEYKWTTGLSDRETLHPGETAHIKTLFEIPKDEKNVKIVWNMETTKGKCTNH